LIGLHEPVSAAAGLVMLASAHDDGWPFPAGGAGRIADALVTELVRLGGRVVTGCRIKRLEDLPPHNVALLDITPRQLLEIAGDRLPSAYRRALARFRYGPGVFKLDIAVEGAIPWNNPEVAQAGTVHLGGTFEEIAECEAAVAASRIPARPFVLLAQQSQFDLSRAPAGHHTAWAYCHVPNGCGVDMTEPILSQIERFAHGFRRRILLAKATSPAEFQKENANRVGGDIAGGRQDLAQLFTRPSRRVFDPYSTPDPRILLCSASTPPGGGVHGMCGYHAARSAARRLG
jgi:phytoene dehydrogenase-like protein